ncbi:MAG: hypothetical protein ACJAVI_000876 [Candidatus Azotimanducaceae bacterium]
MNTSDLQEAGEIRDGRYPDIEIYMQRVEPPALIEWLKSKLQVTNRQEKGKSIVLTLGAKNLEAPPVTCTIVPDAVKGHFTSVWITPNETKWLTDQDFARDAFEHFQLETRCSTGSWDGNDEQGWLRLTQNGESIVNWLAD